MKFSIILCPHLFKHQGGCVNYEHCACTAHSRSSSSSTRPEVGPLRQGTGTITMLSLLTSGRRSLQGAGEKKLFEPKEAVIKAV